MIMVAIAVNTKKVRSRPRSAIAPDTMVQAVAAKTSWKKRKTYGGRSASAPPFAGKKLARPMKAFPSPNITP
jgi:hypothetical protein